MLRLKKINGDEYLQKFVDFCKKRWGNNLIAIAIYGSYVWGYFDEQKSDYDLFVIFKDRPPDNKRAIQRELRKRFPKVSLQYFCTADELLRRIREGHWSIYITLLKSAKVLYNTDEYKEFLKKLNKLDFVEQLEDTDVLKYKAKIEIKALDNLKGYKAAKWALPSIRKRLQLLAYIKRRKKVWKLERAVRLNKDILKREEKEFILDLNKRVKNREKSFTKEEKEMSKRIFKKLSRLIIKELDPKKV